MPKDRLDAYRGTSYLAHTPRGTISIRVGQRSPELDRLLLERGAAAWAFVTAFNPGSVPLDQGDNHERQARLERDVAAAGFRSLPGEGVGDDATWPPEPSLLVLGIDRAAAIALGRRFGQAAIVCGVVGRAAELVVL